MTAAAKLGNVLSNLAVAVGCVLFLGGFAWGAVVYKPYTVPTDSMTPTVNSRRPGPGRAGGRR